MKIQTLSIVVGTTACNASCPFCVSRMTPAAGVSSKKIPVNWRNLDVACRLAKGNAVSTVLITGKGEPTLTPSLITDYLKALKKYEFPFIELQTNGIALAEGKDNSLLKQWYKEGLTTVAISCVHHDSKANHSIYRPGKKPYYSLIELIDKIHQVGLSVRLTCMMMKGYIDSPANLHNMIMFAQESNVEQLTVRTISRPENCVDKDRQEFVDEFQLSPKDIEDLKGFLDGKGTRVLELTHGAIVYDYKGQNVCLSNCLTLDSDEERIRQLIFFPDGRLRYDWQYTGATLL